VLVVEKEIRFLATPEKGEVSATALDATPTGPLPQRGELDYQEHTDCGIIFHRPHNCERLFDAVFAIRLFGGRESFRKASDSACVTSEKGIDDG
jgi:hypothetical protein